jgi:hypothetical protein
LEKNMKGPRRKLQDLTQEEINQFRADHDKFHDALYKLIAEMKPSPALLGSVCASCIGAIAFTLENPDEFILIAVRSIVERAPIFNQQPAEGPDVPE